MRATEQMLMDDRSQYGQQSARPCAATEEGREALLTARAAELVAVLVATSSSRPA